jgi:CHASE1-domain containing sensor protein
MRVEVQRNNSDGKQFTFKFGLFYYPLTSWIILSLSLAVTVYLLFISNKYVNEQSELKFSMRTHEIVQAIESRMGVYESLLRSAVGVFVASESVTREEWKSYVNNINLLKYWPGIQGMGFAIPVSAENKEEHIQKIREEGFADYTIRPEGIRKEYSSVIYLEPFDWRNQRAFGYDMWSNEVRREAMTRARDTGEAATSGLITLVQETDKDVQVGFLTYLPVYKPKGFSLSTVEERRKAFMGWVYSPFRANDLMSKILGEADPAVSFEIYDGEKMSAETLLFDSNKRLHFLNLAEKPKYTKNYQMNLQGRTWTIYFESIEDFGNFFERNQPTIMAVGGVLINILIFYSFYSFSHLRKRATKIAREMNRELVATKENLEQKVLARTKDLEEVRADLEEQVEERTKQLENRMKDLERTNRLMIGRENRMAELKEKIKELRELLGQQNETNE